MVNPEKLQANKKEYSALNPPPPGFATQPKGSSNRDKRFNRTEPLKQEIVSITYEEIGFFPRSFNKVLDRFFKQVFSDVENLVIQEYRFYRYLFLTTLKCLLILFFVPFFINFFAKTYLVRPLTEYFWNTQQTEIFLNSYQQKRAFSELKDFEEKLYFESLIAPVAKISLNLNATSSVSDNFAYAPLLLLKNPPGFRTETKGYIQSEASMPGEHKENSLNPPGSSNSSSLAPQYLPFTYPFFTFGESKPSGFSFSTLCFARGTKACYLCGTVRKPGGSLASLASEKTTEAKNPLGCFSYLSKDSNRSNPFVPLALNLRLQTLRVLRSQEPYGLVALPLRFGTVLPSLPLRCVYPKGKKQGTGGSAATNPLDSPARATFRIRSPAGVASPLTLSPPLWVRRGEMVRGRSKPLIHFVDLRARAMLLPKVLLPKGRQAQGEQVAGVIGFGEPGPSGFFEGFAFLRKPLATPLIHIPAMKKENNKRDTFEQRLQEKIIELAIRYNNQSIEAITNFFADLLSFITLCYLLFVLEIQINITKSFLLEVFFGLDDSKKSLLILLITDLLVGYHSSNLWELFFEFLFNHYGLPESQTGIFLLVATLPVLLDVLFKYLIFRHLNRSSPATVATYHAMIE